MAFSSNEGKLFFKDWCLCFKPQKVLDIGPGAGVYSDILKEVLSENLYNATRRAKDGAGSWREVTELFENGVNVTGIEIFANYASKFALNEKYSSLIIGDAVDCINDMDSDFDLIIFGDMLDHLSKDRAIQLWKKAKAKSRFLWFSLAVRLAPDLAWYKGYSQTPEEYQINIYEKQLYKWGFDELLAEFGPFLWQAPFKTVVCGIAEGDVS